jgi:SagB-type dehydrogenase family enzyme
MSNQNTEAAWEYHNRTKHSFESVRRNAHFLDWENRPFPFKIYPDLDPLRLPQEMEQTGVAALSAIAVPDVGPREVTPDLEDLARLLYFSAGITKRLSRSGGEILFRAAACTGALYEIELYLVCARLPDLAAGVYHFNPGDLALRRLREGDYRGVVAAACGQEPAFFHAPAIVISTGIYWRNAWKYQARTYRHFGWDNGTILSNLLAVAAALGLPTRLVCGFVDETLNRLLGLDVDREVTLSLVALGRSAGTPAPEPVEVRPLRLPTIPLSAKEVDYSAMRKIHQASSLTTPDEVVAWRDREAPPRALPSLSADQMPRDTLEEVILRRGSTRRFQRESIGLAHLSTVLDRSTRGISADFVTPGAQLNEIYLVVHAVEGLAPGSYYYNLATRRLEILKQQELRDQTAHLALDQDLAGDAAVAVFFLADLKQWLDRFGNRGYRLVQLEAGILGGKMYLACYAQGLGATGLTFYDDEVAEFFSPEASGKSAIFLVALGRPERRPT